MEIALFLHLYQPPTQFPEVLEKIVRECYDPALTALENNPQVRLTVNMSASLTEQLSVKHWPVLAKFRRLCERRQVELTGSAAYHPLLIYLPQTEVARQIKINEEINGRLWQIDAQKFRVTETAGVALVKGFFPPEMAVNPQVLETVQKANYSYIMTDEGVVDAHSAPLLREGHIFTDRATSLKVVCRHKQLSLDVAFARVRKVSDLLSGFADTANGHYLVLAMDGETFGHHQPIQLNFLTDLFNTAVAGSGQTEGIEMVSISDLLSRNSADGPIEATESSWAQSFERWKSPANPIHNYQWQLLNLAVLAVSAYPERDDDYWRARHLLDKGLHSDQFWWAAHNPCWHYKMVQRGALLLLEAIESLREENPDVKKQKAQAEDLYHKITVTSLEMYGDAVIGC